MKVLYSPVRSDETIDYIFEGTTITCTLNGQEYAVYDVTTLEGINPYATAEFMPVRSVWKDADGVYWVKLLYYHELDAEEAERFPDWVDV